MPFRRGYPTATNDLSGIQTGPIVLRRPHTIASAPPYAEPYVQLVQHIGDTSNGTPGTTTTVLTVSKTVTSGNVIIVGFGTLVGIQTSFTATDNLGNTYTSRDFHADGTRAVDIIAAPVTVGGTLTTITVTHVGVATYKSLIAAEFANVGAFFDTSGVTLAFSGVASTIFINNKTIPADGVAFGFMHFDNDRTPSSGAAAGTPSISPTLELYRADGANISGSLWYARAPVSSVTGFTGNVTWTVDTTGLAGGAIFEPKVATAYNRTLTDALGFSDTVDRIFTGNRTLTDSVTLGNTVARVATLIRTLADTVTTSESVARVLALGRTLADTVTVGNTVARVFTGARTLADTVATSESVTRIGTFLRSAADSLNIAETVAASKVIARTLADTVTTSESVTRTLTLARTLADTVTAGNTVARVVTLARTAADTVTASDVVTRTGTFLRTAADALTISESVTALKVIVRTLTDSVSVGNTVARTVTLARTLSDALSVGDSVTRVTTAIRSAADSIGVSESVTRALAAVRTAADAVSISTVVSAIKDLTGIVGGLPPVAYARSFIARARGRNDVPGGRGSGPTPGGDASNPKPRS